MNHLSAGWLTIVFLRHFRQTWIRVAKTENSIPSYSMDRFLLNPSGSVWARKYCAGSFGFATCCLNKETEDEQTTNPGNNGHRSRSGCIKTHSSSAELRADNCSGTIQRRTFHT